MCERLVHKGGLHALGVSEQDRDSTPEGKKILLIVNIFR